MSSITTTYLNHYMTPRGTDNMGYVCIAVFQSCFLCGHWNSNGITVTKCSSFLWIFKSFLRHKTSWMTSYHLHNLFLDHSKTRDRFMLGSPLWNFLLTQLCSHTYPVKSQSRWSSGICTVKVHMMLTSAFEKLSRAFNEYRYLCSSFKI